MSTGEARRSQSATTFFNKKAKNGEETDARSSKRKRDETNPVFLIEQASTSTLVNNSETSLLNTTQIAATNTTQNSSPGVTLPQNINKEGVALKLNRLKEKQARYESHKGFLTRCIAEKLVPKGLKLELEPTLGNHDQEFLDNWFSKLNEFSLNLMNDIVTFCDKTIAKTNEDVKNTEFALKSATEKEEFEQIERAIKTNEESTKRLLQQKKFKKYNTLKHKPQQTSSKETDPKENEKGRPVRSYANALLQDKRRSQSQEHKQHAERDQSNTSRNTSTNDLSNSEPTSIQKKIQFLNPNKGKQTRAKSPTRSHSKTNNMENEQVKQQSKEIEQLKKEIAQLKQNQTDELKNKSTNTNHQIDHSKNLQVASNSGGQNQFNMKTEVTEVMNFIQQTMATLQSYNEKLKQHLNMNTTQLGA